MPLPAIIAAVGEARAAVSASATAIATIDSIMSNWLPSTYIVNKVKCQGKKGTPIRVTLHAALATLYGMSLSNKGHVFTVTATVNHRDNVVEVESILSATALGPLAPGAGGGDPAPPPPRVPGGIPLPRDGRPPRFGEPPGEMAFLPGVSESDRPIDLRIVGVSPNYSSSDITEPPESTYSENPKLIVKSVVDPALYRGLNRNISQTSPNKAPWLVTRL